MALSRIFDGALVALGLMGALQLAGCKAETARYLGPVAANITHVSTSAHVTVGEGEESHEARTIAALGAGLAGGDASLCFSYPDGVKTVLRVEEGEVFSRDEAGYPAKMQPEFAEFVEGHQFHRIYLAPGDYMTDAGAPGEALDWHRRTVVPVSGKTRFGSPLTFYFLASANSGRSRMAGFDLTLKDGEGGNYTISVIMDRMLEEDGVPLFTSLQITDRGELFNYGFHELDLTFEGETPPEFVC